MSQFSINYAGVSNTVDRIYELYSQIYGVADDLYSIANQVDGIPSLENKSYGRDLRENGILTRDQADVLKTQRYHLDEIGRTYSGTEYRVLDILSDLVSSSGFSEDSIVAAQNALKSHQSYTNQHGLGWHIKDNISDSAREVTRAIEGFRYWRSTTGSELVKKYAEQFLEDGIENPVVKEAIEDLNKKWGGIEDMYIMCTNPTNPDALAAGAKAMLGLVGLGGFADMFPRYGNMIDAVTDRASEMWSQGDKGKAVCYTLSATTLTTFQFLGDTTYNTVKFGFNSLKGKAFKGGEKLLERQIEKSSWKIAKEGSGKLTSYGEEELEGFFTDAGNWCWSRLDSAYGL